MSEHVRKADLIPIGFGSSIYLLRQMSELSTMLIGDLFSELSLTTAHSRGGCQ